MTTVPVSPVMHHGASGSGATAPAVAGWLALAATPTFGLMALWTGLSSGPSDMLCMHEITPPLNGMTAMYLLMSAFHAAPWLRLIAGRV